MTASSANKTAKLVTIAIESNRGAKAAIQAALVQIQQHAMRHGNYAEANRLVKEMPESVRKECIVLWLKEYVGLKTDGKTFTGWNGSDYITKTRIQEGIKTDWAGMIKAPNPFKIKTANELAMSFITQMERQLKKAEENGKLDEVDYDQTTVVGIKKALGLCGFNLVKEEEKQTTAA